MSAARGSQVRRLREQRLGAHDQEQQPAHDQEREQDGQHERHMTAEAIDICPTREIAAIAAAIA